MADFVKGTDYLAHPFKPFAIDSRTCAYCGYHANRHVYPDIPATNGGQALAELSQAATHVLEAFKIVRVGGGVAGVLENMLIDLHDQMSKAILLLGSATHDPVRQVVGERPLVPLPNLADLDAWGYTRDNRCGYCGSAMAMPHEPGCNNPVHR